MPGSHYQSHWLKHRKRWIERIQSAIDLALFIRLNNFAYTASLIPQHYIARVNITILCPNKRFVWMTVSCSILTQSWIFTGFGEGGVNYSGRKYNSCSVSFTRYDSLLLGCCLVPLEHVLSGWWCGPPEGDWWCPCLHSLTGQWSSSVWPALGVPPQPAAAHMGFETKALQWWKKNNSVKGSMQQYKCPISHNLVLFVFTRWRRMAISSREKVSVGESHPFFKT